MSRILKVFATGAEQDKLAEKVDVLERYDAFLLVEAGDAEVKRLSRGRLVEDITDEYEIPVGAGTIDTSQSRARGRRLPPGPHHYLVQFVGPIKDGWLRAPGRD